MSTEEGERDIAEHRIAIDALDRELLRLLNERAAHAQQRRPADPPTVLRGGARIRGDPGDPALFLPRVEDAPDARPPAVARGA